MKTTTTTKCFQTVSENVQQMSCSEILPSSAGFLLFVVPLLMKTVAIMRDAYIAYAGPL